MPALPLVLVVVVVVWLLLDLFNRHIPLAAAVKQAIAAVVVVLLVLWVVGYDVPSFPWYHRG